VLDTRIADEDQRYFTLDFSIISKEEHCGRGSCFVVGCASVSSYNVRVML